MMFKKRIERAFAYLRSKKEQEVIHDRDDIVVEKNDMFAMIISALITIVPFALFALLFIGGIAVLLFTL